MAAGVNPVDAKEVWGDKAPRWLRWLVKRTVRGKIPGFDFSGVVVDTGEAVYGTVPPFVGTFCEFQRVPVSQLRPKPRNLSFVQAAALPLAGLTCVQCLQSPGNHVLVIGASGGVGHYATQYAKNVLKTERVVGVCGPRNVDWVSSSSCVDRVIDYEKDWKAALREEVERFGAFSFVLDTVSSADPRDLRTDYASFLLREHRTTGKYVTLGGPPGAWFKAGLKRLFGLNLFPHNRELFWVRFPDTRDDLDRLAAAAEGASSPSSSSSS